LRGDFIYGHLFSKETQKTMRLESEANIVVSYGTDRKFDLGIGKFDGGAQNLIRFTFDELQTFFDRQNNKSLIVVIIEKNIWSNERIKEEVERLRSYFVARGYKRISIQQGLGGGRGEYLDYKSPNSPNYP